MGGMDGGMWLELELRKSLAKKKAGPKRRPKKTDTP